MKITILIILATLITVASSCRKKTEPPMGSDKILIGATTADTISYLSAKVTTQLISAGDNQISQHGHCWSFEANPDIGDAHTSLGNISNPGKFTSDLSSLTDNIKYFIRPYFSYQGGTVYGAQIDVFTLKRGKPIVVADSAFELTVSSVKIRGTAIFDSGSIITQKGICWDTTSNPTVQKSIGYSEEGAGAGSFVTSITLLTDSTQYYYCAYAINEIGASYSDIKSFQTLTISKPTVSTYSATEITSATATSGGNVTDNGGATVTARGVCYNVSPNPTLANNFTSDGSGPGSFTSRLTGLTANTLYYVRAYATNSSGTGYGNDSSFYTLFICGSTITINHVKDLIAPVTKTVTYSTVSNIPGEPFKCWITSNLGADRQAIAVNDATEASAGWYWKFNRKQGYKHTGAARIPNTTWVTSVNEDSDWLAANDPCNIELGNTWRVPTYTELNNVYNTGGWTDWNGPWNSLINLHAAGCLYSSSGSLVNRGSIGYYWSSSQISAANSWNLSFHSTGSVVTISAKSYGFPLRCLIDY
ncbi:MAG: hypothetical protein NT004_06120 [Bacteroidetes bacterium]|nr:hypothetical protein [Bacteroidota bacterium]